jgi:hypothetical protein
VNLEELYKFAVARLESEKVPFAVCGGVAAMLYRVEIRVTGDIDFLISPDDLSLPSKIIEAAGLTPNPLKLGQLTMAPRANKKQTPLAVVVGRSPTNKLAPGLDFLLPVQAWTKKALVRAQSNCIQLHDISSPFITAEDVILAKFTALQDSGGRRIKDWDDVQSIFASGRELDLAYLAAELESLKLRLPKEYEKELPKAIAVTMKRLRGGR